MTVFGEWVALDLWFWLAMVAVAVGGFLRGYSGFGSALAIIPVLAVSYGPQAAVAMHAIMEIPVILRLLPDAFARSERRTGAPMLLALLAVTPVGALALRFVDPEIMRIVISIVVLGMVGLLALGPGLPLFQGRRGAVLAGGLGGLTQGATGVGGPPVVAALLARGDGAATARANVVAVMSSLIALSIVVFALYGLVDRQVLVIGALAAPVCLLTTMAGAAVFQRTNGEGFRGLALWMLAALAGVTLITALGQL
ncbi:MAG: TSUP family transporter [Pseudomonadota bacterium]